jgi:hypothetical protein
MTGTRTRDGPRVHLGTNPYTLVASTYRDHGMGPPYDPHWILHCLYRAEHREHGKRYFMQMGSGGVGWTWVSDERAAAIKADYEAAGEYSPRAER